MLARAQDSICPRGSPAEYSSPLGPLPGSRVSCPGGIRLPICMTESNSIWPMCVERRLEGKSRGAALARADIQKETSPTGPNSWRPPQSNWPNSWPHGGGVIDDAFGPSALNGGSPMVCGLRFFVGVFVIRNAPGGWETNRRGLAYATAAVVASGERSRPSFCTRRPPVLLLQSPLLSVRAYHPTLPPR